MLKILASIFPLQARIVRSSLASTCMCGEEIGKDLYSLKLKFKRGSKLGCTSLFTFIKRKAKQCATHLSKESSRPC